MLKHSPASFLLNHSAFKLLLSLLGCALVKALVKDKAFSFPSDFLRKSKTEDDKRHVFSMGSCMEAGLAFVSLVIVFEAGSTVTGMGKVFSTCLPKNE